MTQEDQPHPSNSGRQFVSRGGQKLHHALLAFTIDPTGLHCVDLGCSTGGFTDCLLQAGAARVIAIDTAYGVLAWKLRTDPRVSVRERTSALHAEPVSDDERADLVVLDLGWTPQRLAIPAALRWLKHSEGARIISLIKPHYELDDDEKRTLLHRGVLQDDDALRIARTTADSLGALGVRVLGLETSPIRGGGAGKKGGAARGGTGAGNLEVLALLRRA